MKEGHIVDIERKAMAHIDALREQCGMSERSLVKNLFPTPRTHDRK